MPENFAESIIEPNIEANLTFDIVIVGLGPGGSQQLTIEAQRVLAEAPEVYLRTARHPVVKELPASLLLHSFDHVYESSASFTDVYESIAAKVLELAARPEGVIYAVPGHPLVAEESVRRIIARARERGLRVRIVSAVSFLDSLFTLLDLDPLDSGLQVVDALLLTEYASSWHGPQPGQDAEGRRHAAAAIWSRPPFDPTQPLIVAQLHSQSVASSVKLVLQEFYPEGHPIYLARWAGVPGHEEKREVRIFELDRQGDIDHLTSLYVPSIPLVEDLASLAGLRYILARLRAPGGCPWDRKQTHASLKPYLVEETYEVVDALDAGDPEMLAEELGDLLLQIGLHAQLATEMGEFMLEDVCRGINAKLIRRHPHVFGEKAVSDAAEVVRNWDMIKREEKGEEASSLAKVPKALPALAYAQAIQRRAARQGFDWPDVAGVVDKVAEEVHELTTAPTSEERNQEFGDLLFALVNVARWLDIDAEDALRIASQKFVGRFRRVEEMGTERNLELSKLSLEELDALWEEAKSAERDSSV